MYETTDPSDGMIAETLLKWEKLLWWKCQKKSESTCCRILRSSTLSMNQICIFMLCDQIKLDICAYAHGSSNLVYFIPLYLWLMCPLFWPLFSGFLMTLFIKYPACLRIAVFRVQVRECWTHFSL